MLYLVPTPIGNLEDITLRALRILSEVDLIACEDTRTSRVLLSKHDISTKVTSYHEHNERTKAKSLVDQMLAGSNVALISDAGSPGISDPGFYLVRECIRNDIRVEALPGPSAIIPALTASGLPSDKFVFEGFLPAKKGRKTRIDQLAGEERTIIFYESPHRIGRTLRDLVAAFGEDRPAVVARELTKLHETLHRGTLGSLHEEFEQMERVRGEIVLIVGPVPKRRKGE